LRRRKLQTKRGEFAQACARAGLFDAISRYYRRDLEEALAVFTLGGCGTNDPGALLIDPGRYDAYHCNDLAARWKVLVAREKELTGLIDKANESQREQRRRGDRLARLPHRRRIRAQRREAAANYGGGEELRLQPQLSKRPDDPLNALKPHSL
jgi:hypothetical protein